MLLESFIWIEGRKCLVIKRILFSDKLLHFFRDDVTFAWIRTIISCIPSIMWSGEWTFACVCQTVLKRRREMEDLNETWWEVCAVWDDPWEEEDMRRSQMVEIDHFVIQRSMDIVRGWGRSKIENDICTFFIHFHSLFDRLKFFSQCLSITLTRNFANHSIHINMRYDSIQWVT